VERQWSERHAKAVALRDRLSSLHQAVPEPQADADTLWDKARALIDLEGDSVAVPLLRQILGLRADHPGANFCLGRHLLTQNDSAGESYVERAMSEDEQSLNAGSQLLHAYFRRTGQTSRLRELEARLDRYERNFAHSRDERRTVTAADTVISHGLDDASLDPLRQLLTANPDIITAHLGQKQLDHFAQQRLFLLCIRVRRAWHRLPDRDRETASINRLMLAAPLPGRVFIFAPARPNAGLARKLGSLPDAEIFRR
jgi:thioredoxin-like negative regulator of GroEL